MICKKKYILFDLDGTLVDSSGPIKYLWDKWSFDHGLDSLNVYNYSIGRPAIDTMRHFLGEINGLKCMSDLFVQNELDLANDVVSIPGAIDFVKSIPANQWCIVTSCSKELAYARMAAVNLDLPNVLVTSESVIRGKPNSDCYIKAAELLNARSNDCVVFEDSNAGILSANSAGMDVISVNNLNNTAIFCISDYFDIVIREDNSRFLTLEARNEQ